MEIDEKEYISLKIIVSELRNQYVSFLHLKSSFTGAAGHRCLGYVEVIRAPLYDTLSQHVE